MAKFVDLKIGSVPKWTRPLLVRENRIILNTRYHIIYTFHQRVVFLIRIDYLRK